jgi:uncharacterized protein YrzB (UPF0473 family)
VGREAVACRVRERSARVGATTGRAGAPCVTGAPITQEATLADTENEELDVFTLVDEDGNEVDFALLAVIELEDEGQFAVMAPVDQVEEDAPSLDLEFFHLTEVGEDDIQLDPVDDEDLLALLYAKAGQMLGLEEEDED